MTVHIAENELQILYADTDMMGVIYHGNYIKWLEIGRRQLIEDIGYDYLTMEKNGYLAPVHNVDITYDNPLKYGDKAILRTWIEENTGVRIVYGFEIVNQDGLICTHGATTLLVVKKVDGKFKPVVFKRVFPEWFSKYEEIKVKK